MKPLKLTMEAFGPFCEKQVLDFSQLEDMFLISGTTGAGKTTIFDAISMALFGEASGDIRQSDNFKSDFANPNDTCSVELVFEVNKKIYTVYREPKQVRLNRNNEAKVYLQTVELTMPDGSVISSVSEANEKIVEVLGIVKEQFNRIVMLPQGEFRKFLEDKSNKKQELLRKLFSTHFFDEMAVRLQQKSKELEQQLKKANESNRFYVNTIESDNEQLTQAKKAEYLNCDQIIKLVEIQITSDKEKLKEIKNDLQKLEQNKQKNNIELANSINEKFKQLEKIKQKLSELEGQTEQINSLKNDLEFFKAAQNFLELDQKLKLIESEIQTNTEKKRQFEEKKTSCERLIERANCFEQITNIKKDILSFEKFFKNVQSYKNSISKYNQLKEKYENDFASLLKQQAYLLSLELKEQQPCPVCGSKSHPNKASKQTSEISEAMLEQSKKQYQNQYDMLNEITSTIKSELSLLQTKGFCGDVEFSALLNNIDLINSEQNALKEKLNVFEQQFDELTNQLYKKNVTDVSTNKDYLNINYLNDINNRVNSTIEACEQIINTNEAQKLDIQKQIQVFGYSKEQVEKIYLLKQNAEQIQNKINDFNNQFEIQKQLFENLGEQLKGAKPIDTEQMQVILAQINQNIKQLNKQQIDINTRINTNTSAFKNIKTNLEQTEKIDEKYKIINKLSKLSSGDNAQGVSFERFVIASYFEDIIVYANLRLRQITNDRFILKRRVEKEKYGASSGLELEIFDAYTGKTRHVNTLSGGESFKTALCMALGLADVITQNAGRIQIETLFIDEGFGTLDATSLELAINCLKSLNVGGTMIGIISHVNELKEIIKSKINVNQGMKGSSLQVYGGWKEREF